MESSRSWLFGVCQGWFALSYNEGRFGCCVTLDLVLRAGCGDLVRLHDR